MRYVQEIEESRFSQTASEILNKELTTSKISNQDIRLTRTNSTGQNNIKNKLDTFGLILNTLSEELRVLRQETSDSRDNCKNMNRNLLSDLDDRTKKQLIHIKGTENKFKAGMNKSNDRMDFMNRRCNQLTKQTTDITNRFDWLKQRTEKLEAAMGYYSAIEKYKS